MLKYLAPYVNRVAISDSRIIACDDSSVTYRYRPSGSNNWKERTVLADELMRRFTQHTLTQHTLPSGLQKIRHYGWMGSNCRVKLDEVKWLLWLFLGWTYWLASGLAPQREPTADSKVRCGHCGGELVVIDVTFDPAGQLSEHALAYLDNRINSNVNGKAAAEGLRRSCPAATIRHIASISKASKRVPRVSGNACGTSTAANRSRTLHHGPSS